MEKLNPDDATIMKTSKWTVLDAKSVSNRRQISIFD